ncbi:hypothetical protein [Gallintestinimicrobium sp.]|uniref:hypothetical protein n=1 Tax=Gallintestinimicrobium sp. TaxID=2981655 RepID=UPI0039969A96
MKKNIIIILMLMILAIMVGCGGNVNSSENTQKNKYIENDTQEVLTEGDEEKETQGEKIKYYDSLDNHAQSIYDKFIECDWVSVRDLLEEFKRPEGDQVMVYTTPLENLRLVVEYVSDIRAWQAYLGEFSNEEKTGKGVIVSCRDQGNAEANVYIGMWDNNMPNGSGILSDQISDLKHIYRGTFKDGRLDGKIQVNQLETPGIGVDWEKIEPLVDIDEAMKYADLSFDDGKPIPVSVEVVDQYIEISKHTERELEPLAIKRDEEAYYRVFDGNYNYILSVGAKEPSNGTRYQLDFIYGTYFDSKGNTAIYGVARYANVRLKTV